MATEVWVAIATAGVTVAFVLGLVLFIHWTVGRSVRSEVGTNILPVLDLTKHVTLLVDQGRQMEQAMQAQLDEVNQLKLAFDDTLDQIRSQTDEQQAAFARFATEQQEEIERTVEQAHAQIVQTLDVMNWTESEANRLVEDLRGMQEEVQLEFQVRGILSRIAADHNRTKDGPRLRFGRITTDSPFLDFVVRADGKPPRYLSLQIKALGDYHATEALQHEVDRAIAIKSAMPENGAITSIIVVNRLPNGSDDLTGLLSSLDDTGVDVVPVDEFCEYVLDWTSSRESAQRPDAVPD